MKREHFLMMCAAASAAAVTMGGATAALAQQQVRSTTVVGERLPDEGRSVGVSYRDLNLAAARDEQILQRRVKAAVRSVCEPDVSYLITKTFADCASFAWNGANPQIALAVRRAREIAATGASSVPLVAITVVGLR